MRIRPILGIPRLAAFALGATLLSSPCRAQDTKPAEDKIDRHNDSTHRPVTLVPGLGNANHPIHTSSPAAQAYFNQGLNYIYAFNHDEARRSFEKAAQLDPSAPMPLWGVALAVGPNYNDIDIGHTREQAAIKALDRAAELAASASFPTSAPTSAPNSGKERDYVHALSRRYSADSNHEPRLQGQLYSQGMAALVQKYPDDLDAATLYAESLMDLNPWKLWSADGTPAPNTDIIVSTLQGVLRRDPDHVGANHLLIHAVEASPNPGIALASADRLRTLAPGAGHLVHMPAHIYQRVGDFSSSATANRQAIAADQSYFKSQNLHSAGEMYYDMYYVHNIHFLASACSMEGNATCTEKAAAELVQYVTPAVPKDKIVEWFLPTQPWMLVRFQQWNQILAAPAPAASMTVLTAMWHYARGCAFVGLHQLPQAKGERAALAQAGQDIPKDALPDFNNPASAAFTLALDVLDARLLEETGQLPEAIQTWRKAVTLLDTFAYNEPADWYYPVRESLGGALLRAHQPAEAEAVFRRDLQLNPGNGRSLFGVWQSLILEHRTAEAAKAKAAFTTVWRHADTPLTIQAL